MDNIRLNRSKEISLKILSYISNILSTLITAFFYIIIIFGSISSIILLVLSSPEIAAIFITPVIKICEVFFYVICFVSIFLIGSFFAYLYFIYLELIYGSIERRKKNQIKWEKDFMNEIVKKINGSKK